MNRDLSAAVARSWDPDEYPALAAQADTWMVDRPLAGVRVLDATPVYANTMVKYAALLAGGAQVTVGAPTGIPADADVLRRLPDFGIAVATSADLERTYDVVLDCAGAHAGVASRFGYAELTRSGLERYAGCPQPVVMVDSGLVKQIETTLGTGDGFLRAMVQLGHPVRARAPVVVLGGGKVGFGVAAACRRAGATVTVVDPARWRCRRAPTGSTPQTRVAWRRWWQRPGAWCRRRVGAMRWRRWRSSWWVGAPCWPTWAPRTSSARESQPRGPSTARSRSTSCWPSPRGCAIWTPRWRSATRLPSSSHTAGFQPASMRPTQSWSGRSWRRSARSAPSLPSSTLPCRRWPAPAPRPAGPAAMSSLLLRSVVLDGRVTDVRIQGRRFADIGVGCGDRLPPDRQIDGRGRMAIVPAFYNGHTHAAMTLLRGYAEDLELGTWLSEHIWPAEATLTAEDVYAGTRLAILEMIKSGTVYFNDMYWEPSASAMAAIQMGYAPTSACCTSAARMGFPIPSRGRHRCAAGAGARTAGSDQRHPRPALALCHVRRATGVDRGRLGAQRATHPHPRSRDRR